MIDSIEMDEVGTQGQGGRENQDQERDKNQPRRDDKQDQSQPSKKDQPGKGNRQGQQEDEEEN